MTEGDRIHGTPNTEITDYVLVARRVQGSPTGEQIKRFRAQKISHPGLIGLPAVAVVVIAPGLAW
jgi:hypothetical protein